MRCLRIIAVALAAIMAMTACSSEPPIPDEKLLCGVIPAAAAARNMGIETSALAVREGTRLEFLMCEIREKGIATDKRSSSIRMSVSIKPELREPLATIWREPQGDEKRLPTELGQGWYANVGARFFVPCAGNHAYLMVGLNSIDDQLLFETIRRLGARVQAEVPECQPTSTNDTSPEQRVPGTSRTGNS